MGLTGGIGSGKSVVAREFTRMGAIVLSADDEAKALLASDPRVVRKVRRLLGERAYAPDGSPDRAWIASRIFSSPARRRALNAIIHPAVIAGQRRAIAAVKRRRTAPMVVVEAALVYEAGMEVLFDAVVVVDTPVRERVRRVAERDRVPAAHVLRRIRAQGSPARHAAKADIVIRNRAGLRALRAAARLVFRILAASAKTPAGATGAAGPVED